MATTDEFLPVAVNLLPAGVDPKDCFAVRVNGDSMSGAGIQSGSLAVVSRTAEITPGSVVLARWGNGVTVKRYTLDEHLKPALMPENPAFKPVPIGPDTEIIGRVVQVTQMLM